MESFSSQGGELFKTTQGFPVTFSLSPLCPERKEAQDVIEMWGGTVTGQAGGLHTIRLVDKKGSGFANHGSEDAFKLQYVYDCVEAEDLLDLKEYRVNPSVYTDEVDVMDILLGNKSWRDAKRLPKDTIGSIGYTEDGCDVAATKSRCRQSYTLQEEKAILQYIIQQCRFDEVKGKTLWVDMEQAKVCPGRSWNSMKERFKKYIVHNIQQFNVKPLFAKKLSESISPGVLKVANMDATTTNKEETNEKDNAHIHTELESKKRISSTVDGVCKRQRVDELPQGASTTHSDKENQFSGGKESNSVREDVMHEQQFFSSVEIDVFKQSKNQNSDISSPEQLKDAVLQSRENLCMDAEDVDCANVSYLTDDIQGSPIDLSQKGAANRDTKEQTNTLRNCQNLHESSNEAPDQTDEHVKPLCNSLDEESHRNTFKYRNESIHISALENPHVELELRPSRCEERDIKNFTDDSHSCYANEKITEACAHKSETEQENGREHSCSALSECENLENYEATNSTNSSVIENSHISVVPEGLVVTPHLDSYEVCIDRRNCREKCQELSSLNVPFEQRVVSKLRAVPQNLPNRSAQFAESEISGNSSVEEIDNDMPYKVRLSPTLFDMEEVIGNKELQKPEKSEDFYVSSNEKFELKTLELKNMNEKKSDVHEEHSKILTCAVVVNGVVESNSQKCRGNLSNSGVVLECSDEEMERCVQVMQIKNKHDSMEISDFSDESEPSSNVQITECELQIDKRYRPQTIKCSPPDEKDKPFGLTQSRYFLKREGHCENSPARDLKGLRHQYRKTQNGKDMMMKMGLSDSNRERSFHRYPEKSDSSHNIKDGVNVSPSRQKDRRGTCWYTMGEDIALLAFIQDCNGYERVGGNQLWKEMEKSGKLKNRTWHSLKERYRKVIIQQLDVYANIQSVKKAVQILRAKCTTPQVVKKEQDTRRPYTHTEDKLILEFIIVNKRYSEVGGKSMWEQMSRQPGLRERTWLSLKERFRRVIIPNLLDYDVSHKARYYFSKWEHKAVKGEQ